MKMQERLRILFLAANPMATSRLDLEEELRSLEAELRAVKHRDDIDLIAAHAVRPDDVVRLLRQEAPTVIHFSGHGSQQGIIMRGDSYDLEVSGPALARVFSNRNIKMVVLNACFSDLQAEALTAAAPVVVGTTASVGDEAARRFSAAFYRTIGNGYPVREAFRDGRDAVDINMLEDVFRLRGDAEIVLCGRRTPATTLKTTADLVGVIGRLTSVERVVFRSVLKASPEIHSKVFREFFRAPNVVSGNGRDGYRFRLAEMVAASPTELSNALNNLLDYGLIFDEQLTDILYRPCPEVVVIVNRSSHIILSLLYTAEDVENRPVEVFDGNTHFQDGKPDYFTDSEGIPLEGPFRLHENSKNITYFRDGKIVDPEKPASG
jgi:CHAT domain